MKSTSSLMSILLICVLTWAGCSENQDGIPGAEIYEADALWVNGLAYDGCSWHLEASTPDTSFSLLPNESSLKKIEAVVKNINTATPLHLKYNLTGAKGKVACGWGATGEYDEIQIIEIRKK